MMLISIKLTLQNVCQEKHEEKVKPNPGPKIGNHHRQGAAICVTAVTSPADLTTVIQGAITRCNLQFSRSMSNLQTFDSLRLNGHKSFFEI